MDPHAGGPKPVASAILDLIGELGREVFCMLDDCETSGEIGQEAHEITNHGLLKVSGVLDRIDALPFEVEGAVLGTGAMMQEAIKQTFVSRTDHQAILDRVAELEVENARLRLVLQPRPLKDREADLQTMPDELYAWPYNPGWGGYWRAEAHPQINATVRYVKTALKGGAK